MALKLMVSDVMTPKIVYVAPDASVSSAASKMGEENISCLIVLSGSRVCGIVTERDLATKVTAKSLNPEKTHVKDVMSCGVKTIASSKNLVDAARLMRDDGIKKLVVVDGQKVVGLISERDILEVDPALRGKDRGDET